MTHLLFILDYYLPHHGGVETVFEQIISRLLKKGYRITLLTSHFDPKLAHFEKLGSLEIHRVGKGRFGFLLAALWKGRLLLRRFPEIKNIHASTYGSAIQASILGYFFKKHVILTVHEVFGKLWYLYKGLFGGFMYLSFERLLFMFPYHTYHCVSRYTMNSIRLLYGIPDEKIALIYNGVDYDFWDSSCVSAAEIEDWHTQYNPAHKTMCLYYGHAGKSKGLDGYIDSIPKLLQEESDLLFVFNIIDSKRKSILVDRIKQIQRRGYSSNIQLFYGMDKVTLRTMLAASDIVVAPSLSEGFGSVHTEVAAMGKPLITSFVSSIPEVVAGRVLFVAPNSPEAIATALLKFKKNQDIFSDTLNPYFDWDDTVSQITNLYRL